MRMIAPGRVAGLGKRSGVGVLRWKGARGVGVSETEWFERERGKEGWRWIGGKVTEK